VVASALTNAADVVAGVAAVATLLAAETLPAASYAATV
jgi:hypothetical protein